MKPTTKTDEFDLVILGCGEASKYLAWELGKEGKRVVVVERKYIGGSCPNIACLPSKNIIHSAKVASYFGRGAEFGITDESYQVQMAGVRERKRKMVRAMVDAHVANFNASGAELLMGSGRFVGPKTLEVALPDGATKVVRGKNVVIGTGSRAKVDAIPGLREAAPMTHVEALELDVVPQHLLIIGGGYVGLELGQAMRRFGSKVTIIERNERLLHGEDEDVSNMLQELFKSEGIEVVTSAVIQRVEGISGKSVKVCVVRKGTELILEGTHLLVAAGRTPNTDGLGLEVAGVQTTAEGHVKVNERLETTSPGVWAAGDCAGSPHFTHISFDDFRIVRDNLNGGNRVTTGRQVPFCMFTDPEFARVGLSETEARQSDIDYRLARIPMATVLRTQTLSETAGFMKALIGAQNDRILGITVVGTGAGEIVGAVQIAIIAELPYTALRDAVLIHPTLLEGLIPLFTTMPRAARRALAAAA